MRLEWIEDILAVIDAGSFAKAAELRHRTPSSFTRRIQKIEEELGTEIFDRSNKPAELIGAVKEQEQKMRKLLLALSELKQDLAQTGQQSASHVSFGLQHAIATTVSPQLIKRITQDDRINVRVRTANRDRCIMMLLTGTVDLAILYGTSEDEGLQISSAVLEANLLTEALIPVASPDFNLKKGNSVRKKYLPLISYPSDVYLGQQLRKRVYPSLLSDYQPRSIVETALTLAATEYALAGIGLAWIPRLDANRHIAAGHLTSFEDVLPVHELNVTLMRARNSTSEIVLNVWEKLSEGCRQSVFEI